MNVIQQEKKQLAVKKTIAKIVKRYADLSKKYGKPITKSGKMDISMSLFYGRDDDFNATNRLRGARARCTLGNLDLDKLLVFEDFSFVHDVVGISSTIVKSSAQTNFGTFSNGFLPRCGFVFTSDNKRSKKGGVSDAADEKGRKCKAKGKKKPEKLTKKPAPFTLEDWDEDDFEASKHNCPVTADFCPVPPRSRR